MSELLGGDLDGAVLTVNDRKLVAPLRVKLRAGEGVGAGGGGDETNDGGDAAMQH
jgi:hypothetical protein